mgnify:CR=1 FL=1
MMKNFAKGLALLITAGLLMGCAGQQMKASGPPFTPHKFENDRYGQKVDNFIVGSSLFHVGKSKSSLPAMR